MPAAITHTSPFWQIHQPSPAWDPEPDNAWHSQIFIKETPQPRKNRATRYEKFTTSMVLLSSVLTLGTTAGLHLFNYGLETETSSTSGTHSEFYKEGE